MIGSSSFLQVTRTTIKAWTSSNLGRIPPLTSELAALERLKKSYNLVSTLAPLFLIGSSSYLQVPRTAIISRAGSDFSQIRPRTVELAALESRPVATYLKVVRREIERVPKARAGESTRGRLNHLKEFNEFYCLVSMDRLFHCLCVDGKKEL